MWNSASDSTDADGRSGAGGPVNDAGGNGMPADSAPVDCSNGAGEGDGPVVAELAVTHRDVVLGDAIRAAPSVTVVPNYRTNVDDAAVLVFTVDGEAITEFDTTLRSDHTVRDPHRIGGTDGSRAYRVRYGPETLRFTPALARQGALLYDVRTEGRSWSFHVRFPSRDAFASFRSYCSTNDVTLRLVRLYEDDQSTRGGDYGLTASQWRTLAAAHEMGYFEVPRGTTQEELARHLGVSPSAVSQRIRRATNQLLGETLGSSRFRSRF